MHKLRTIQICLAMLSFTHAMSQETFGGKPYSFKLNTYNPERRNYVALSPTVATAVLPPYTNEHLIAYGDSVSEARDVFMAGKGFKVNIDIIRDGTCQLINGMNVYRYRVKSEHAKALAFYFNEFYIPRGGSLFFFPYDGKTLYGALNHKNNPPGPSEGIQMSTPPLPGKDWIIEYNVRASKPQGKLVVGLVTHFFR